MGANVANVGQGMTIALAIPWVATAYTPFLYFQF
jgi:hypothetical protein